MLSIASVLISAAYLLPYLYPDIVWLVYSGILSAEKEEILGKLFGWIQFSRVPLLILLLSILAFVISVHQGWFRKDFGGWWKWIVAFFLAFTGVFSPYMSEALRAILERTYEMIGPMQFVVGTLVYIFVGIILWWQKRAPLREILYICLPGAVLFAFAALHLRYAVLNVFPAPAFLLRGIWILWIYHSGLLMFMLLAQTFFREVTWRRWFALVFLYIVSCSAITGMWFLSPPSASLIPPELSEGERIKIFALTPEGVFSNQINIPIDTIGAIDIYVSRYSRLHIPKQTDKDWQKWLTDLRHLGEVRQYLWKQLILRYHARNAILRDAILQSFFYDPMLTFLDVWEVRGRVRQSEGFLKDTHLKLVEILACHGYLTEAKEEEEWGRQRQERVRELLGVVLPPSPSNTVTECQSAERKFGIVKGSVDIPTEGLKPDKRVVGNFFVGLSLYFPHRPPEKRFSFFVTAIPLQADGSFVLAGIPVGQYVPVLWYVEEALREGVELTFLRGHLVKVLENAPVVALGPIRAQIRE